MVALPVIYKSQRNVWMNSEIFAEWFKKDLVPVVKRHQRAPNIRSPKALLLMDNCSAHPEELKTRDGLLPVCFSSKHNFADSVNGLKRLTSNEEPLQEETPSKSDLRSLS